MFVAKISFRVYVKNVQTPYKNPCFGTWQQTSHLNVLVLAFDLAIIYRTVEEFFVKSGQTDAPTTYNGSDFELFSLFVPLGKELHGHQVGNLQRWDRGYGFDYDDSEKKCWL